MSQPTVEALVLFVWSKLGVTKAVTRIWVIFLTTQGNGDLTKRNGELFVKKRCIFKTGDVVKNFFILKVSLQSVYLKNCKNYTRRLTFMILSN